MNSKKNIIILLSNEVFHEYFLSYSFRALYNYKPQNDDEVELSEGKFNIFLQFDEKIVYSLFMIFCNFSPGDVVYVMEKCDDGWFVGTSQRTGIFGTFPGNYVAKA